MVARYPDELRARLTADDMRADLRGGRIASLIGAEGGHRIDSVARRAADLYALGVRYMTLTHNDNVPGPTPRPTSPAHGGLTDVRPRGRARDEPARHAGRPLARRGRHDARRAATSTEAPVIFSHSVAPRGLPTIRATSRTTCSPGWPATAAVIMVAFVPYFVNQESAAWSETDRSTPAPRTTVDDVVAHVEHAREVAGVDHIGIGSDYDGVALFPRRWVTSPVTRCCWTVSPSAAGRAPTSPS